MGDFSPNLVIDPQEFFRNRVAEALANQKLSVRDPVESYIVNLLCDFIHPSRLETVTGGSLSALDTPLAMMLKEAMEAPPTQRVRIFKYLGDTSLYIAGFFQDYFNRKTYDVGYFCSVGASAYENVAVLIRDSHGDKHFASVFNDLAQHFHLLVEVLAEVSESPEENRPVDILAIYDRWNRTQSERLRRILGRFGIVPIPTNVREEN